MSHKFCPQCGSKNEPQNNFCVNCGTPISRQAVAKQVASQTKAPVIYVEQEFVEDSLPKLTKVEAEINMGGYVKMQDVMGTDLKGEGRGHFKRRASNLPTDTKELFNIIQNDMKSKHIDLDDEVND
jgi:hypothetical protein